MATYYVCDTTNGTPCTFTERSMQKLWKRSGGDIARCVRHGALICNETKTVKFHKQKITEKLAVRTGAVLTAYAIRHGIAYAEYGVAVTSRHRLCRTPPD